MTSIKTRLYGGTAPATGEPAELSFFGNDLEVRSASAAHRVALNTVRLREVGTGVRGLELAWDAPEGLHAVQVLDPEAVRSLQGNPILAGLPQMAALHATRRRHSAGRLAGWTVLAILLLLPLLLLLLFL